MANWFTNIFLSAEDRENIRRGDDAEVKIRALNERALTSGQYDAGTYAEAMANLDNPAGGHVSYAETERQLEDAYLEGLSEGKANVSRAIKGTLNTVVAGPLGAILGGIPWWLWIGAAGGAFFYLGGGTMLKGKLKL